MKTIRWMLATYLPMPAALQTALADGTVRTVHNEHGEANRSRPNRRATADRRRT